MAEGMLGKFGTSATSAVTQRNTLQNNTKLVGEHFQKMQYSVEGKIPQPQQVCKEN